MPQLIIANGNVEVARIDPKRKQINIIIHVHEGEAEDIAEKREAMACQYLVEEGFVPEDTEGWMTGLARVFHKKV